mmetsp:Transcript_14177/g.40874  ORF Transcript_14177/g.40874 Transcript_14177/m.40874 type:complete len:232 (+) Transcript_14177:32-727(+)
MCPRSSTPMQPAAMPVTPLARMDWRYGGLPLERDCHPAAPDFGAAAAAQPCCGTAAPPPNAATPGAMVGAPALARYESRDASGRVWGMPSAYGRGQCVDCPRKAAPPSSRCQDCQVRLSQTTHPRMNPEELAMLRAHFDGCASRLADPRVERDIARRLQVLYQLADDGRLPPPLQARLLEAARASIAAEDEQVSRMLARLAQDMAQDGERSQFDVHRQWLVGVRRLLLQAR